MVISPAQSHMHMEELSSAGKPPTRTVGDPGSHGDVVAGTQGIGVKTPIAADVAASTSGFANDEHSPKEGMLSIGAKSMIVAHSMLLEVVCSCEVTINSAGAAPKLQTISAPITT